jgi:hypothetical protein
MPAEMAEQLFIDGILNYLDNASKVIIKFVQNYHNFALFPKGADIVGKQFILLNEFLSIDRHFSYPKYDPIINYGYLQGHIKTNYALLLPVYNFVTSPVIVIPLSTIIIVRIII